MLGLRMAALAMLFGGCADVVNDVAQSPTTSLNETYFKCKVEPVLVAQCSYTACHGIADAALRVYSPGKLRATPPADSLASSAPLTDAEQHANYLSAAGFATFGVAPVDNFLLRKPLPAASGGYEHMGGAIYGGTGDANYVAIFQWLNGGTSCN
jgi:hypothetical protein